MRESELHRHKKSGVLLFIEVVIALTFILGLITLLIYDLGSQKQHHDVPHALDEIFSTTEQKQLIAKLEKKLYQHTTLYGKNSSGIFEFLEHYADNRAGKGNFVVVRRVQNDDIYQTALKFIRQTKEIIEQSIDLEGDSQKSEWIFVVRNGEPPLDEISRIKAKRPKDRIIVGTVKKQAIPGFKTVQYPAINIEDVKEVIASEFGVTAKQAEILINYYKTIPEIIYHLDEISYNHQKHLGQSYQNLKDLGKKQLNTLKKLCKNGQAPLDGNKAALEQIGAVTYNSIVYWNDRINKLNYELSQNIICVDKVIPDQLRIKLEEEAAQTQTQAQLQVETEKQVSEPQTTKNTKKSTKEVKVTPKKEKAKVNKVEKTAKKANK